MRKSTTTAQSLDALLKSVRDFVFRAQSGL